MDSALRRQAGNLLLGAIADDDQRYHDAIRILLDGLGLTAMQYVAVSDRLIATAGISRVLIRGLVPSDSHYQLARMIDMATDALAARDT